MTPKEKESLKWLLVEAKAITDTDDQNPFAGIFLNNLCDVVDEFIHVRDQHIQENTAKHYQVFRVDVCTSDWAMDDVLIGGESVDDVAGNLKEAFSLIDKNGKKRYYEQNMVKRVAKEKDHRIKPVENLYTTTPYKILDRYAYSE